MKATLRCLAVLTALVASPITSALYAQTNDWIDMGSSTSFNDAGNWSFGFAPDANLFENAKIGSDSGIAGASDTPTATVSTNLSATPSSALTLGDGSAYEGTLNITSGGHLITQAGSASLTGGLDVGLNGGTGLLHVSGTGQLEVYGQLATPTGGNGLSKITLSSSAVVSADSATFSKNLRIVGAGVSLSIAGPAIFASGGTHEWAFTTTSGTTGPSTIMVSDNLDLGGTLKLDTLGDSLTIGSNYVIADSASVSNGFSNVDTSSVPGLGLGVSVRAQSAASASSVNGVLTSVVVEQQPILYVNHQSGEVSIRNPGASTSLAMDAYIVGSGLQSLNTANWTTLSSASGWQAANPSAGSLSELNPVSSEEIAGNTSKSLGTIFAPANQSLGNNTGDVTFKFAPEGENFVDGIVIYEGIPTDNLTLNIDRTTGDAQIINGFHETVSIDTYTITSESGSINSGWTPLGGDWQVALDEGSSVSELNPIDSLDLSSNAAVTLGSLFDFDAISAAEDFVFQFTLPNEEFFRTGKVVFENALTTLPQGGLQGDFNDDGTVDAADYTVWRDNLGLSDSSLNGNGTNDGSGLVVAGDYSLWVSQYGTSSSSSPATSVPEPTALALIGMLATLVPFAQRKR